VSVRLDEVWKGYRRWDVGPGRHRRGRGPRPLRLGRSADVHWALRGVSLDAEGGEFVGLIGGNGAGKSTLLRLAAGLGRPDRGEVGVAPGTAAVLTLGDSFDLELSGRENALTAAVVAGLTRRQARAALDDIIGFAELEDFAEAPVRTYSEGMKLRLAFGVVAQLRPPALLLDEVLAVGDIRFQRKCMDQVRRLREAGTTVVLASHDLERAEEECDRIVWLDDGAVRGQGDPRAVIGEYRDAMMSASRERTPAPGGPSGPEGLTLRRNRFGSQEVEIHGVELTPAGPAASGDAQIATGGRLAVSFDLVSIDRLEPGTLLRVVVAIIRRSDGVKCCDSSLEIDSESVAAGARVELVHERLDLVPGDYHVEVGAYRGDWSYAYDLHTGVYGLQVAGPPAGGGVYVPPGLWRVARER
jgi:lipopolysaccharide transport system ATP-binding protein